MNKDIVSTKTLIAFIVRNEDTARITIHNIKDVAGAKPIQEYETMSKGARKKVKKELERMEGKS